MHTSLVGKRYPSEKFVYIDPVTGLSITALTNSPHANSKIYQTHPQWTFDGKYVIFISSRAGDTQQLFAVSEITGEIIQLTDHPGTAAGSVNIARKSHTLYYYRRTDAGLALIKLALDPLLEHSKNGTTIDPDSYETVLMTLPPGLHEAGGFALDAAEDAAYLGVTRLQPDPAHPEGGHYLPTPERASPRDPMPNRLGGLRRVDLNTGTMTTVIDVPFTMGHVQTNPFVPGEIIYCHETGGDAPQRMWFVRGDGTDNRALYAETPDEWITHEAVVDPDHVMFNIMGHLPRLHAKPTGIAVINLRTDKMKILGQCDEERGFWHCNGTSDGRWAVGDTFHGNIYLINRITGQMMLLTTDHKMRPDHAHPTFHPDGKRILFQSGLLTDAASLDLMVVTLPPGLSSEGAITLTVRDPLR